MLPYQFSVLYYTVTLQSYFQLNPESRMGDEAPRNIETNHRFSLLQVGPALPLSSAFVSQSQSISESPSCHYNRNNAQSSPCFWYVLRAYGSLFVERFMGSSLIPTSVALREWAQMTIPVFTKFSRYLVLLYDTF